MVTPLRWSSLECRISMKNIFLNLILFSSFLFTDDSYNNPESVIKEFFYHFNQMDTEKIDALWDLSLIHI